MNEDLKKQPSIVQLMGWPNRQYGSFERYLVQLSHALSDRGADSHFIFQNQSLSREFIRDSSAQFHVVPPARHAFDAGFVRRVTTLLKEVGATHLHVHHGTDAHLGLVAARLSQVKRRFSTRHNTPSMRVYWLRTWQYRWQAFESEKIFAVSDMVANRLIELGMPASKICTHYLGVEPERYRFSEGQRREARERLGIPPSKRVLVSTSHLRKFKGTEILPDLSAALNENPGNVMVLVAGDGPLKERMLARAKELNLGEGSFRMLGICEDVRLLLMAADIFLFTSRGVSEGFGLSVLEGLASGIPVVSTDIVSDFRKFCEDIWILYPPGDLEQLLRACRRLIADPVEAANMGQQAQAFVHARFSTQEAVKIMISAYLDDN